MSTKHHSPNKPSSWSGQQTTRLDHALIHRHHADEAFLADLARTGPDTFTAVAVLPSAHPHYGGHTGPSRTMDPLLLLECARQAETYAAHTLFGVEPDAHFVLRSWSTEFSPSPPGVRDCPTELRLTAQTRNPRTLGARLGRLEYDFELWAAGSRVGRVLMDVGYVSAAAYTVLRSRRRRGGAPPSSDTFVALDGRPADPSTVGRTRPTDVVLLDVDSRGSLSTARLRVPTENQSMFDHAQDHVPAMVLMEAARQFAALVVAEAGGPAPSRTRLVAIEATFDAYAELDDPVDLTAAAPVGSAAGWSVDVHFQQTGAQIAQARIVMAVPEQTQEKETSWAGPQF
ncbi:AfsA-related hotdog domain-containing protein [Micromonospora sp. DT229]|uniref:AfsA-related hotdog domain-containing protein n=1 Tax=Micromonospora sp. DT229 TaxID=3393430 RepID=UPI003CF35E43